jgi:hypothetical protein
MPGGALAGNMSWDMNKPNMFSGMLHEGVHTVLGGDEDRATQAAGAGMRQYRYPISPGMGAEMNPQPWARQMLLQGTTDPDSLLQAAIGDSAGAAAPRNRKKFLDRLLTNDWRK